MNNPHNGTTPLNIDAKGKEQEAAERVTFLYLYLEYETKRNKPEAESY